MRRGNGPTLLGQWEAAINTADQGSYAPQSSAINPDSMFFSLGGQTGLGSSASLFSVTFSLDQGAPYSMSGSRRGGGASGLVSLSGKFNWNFPLNDYSFSRTGFLPAGTYTFSGSLTPSPFSFTVGFSGGLGLTLVPEPGPQMMAACATMVFFARRRKSRQ